MTPRKPCEYTPGDTRHISGMTLNASWARIGWGTRLERLIMRWMEDQTHLDPELYGYTLGRAKADRGESDWRSPLASALEIYVGGHSMPAYASPFRTATTDWSARALVAAVNGAGVALVDATDAGRSLPELLVTVARVITPLFDRDAWPGESFIVIAAEIWASILADGWQGVEVSR